jgi:hypothetical protein
LFGERYGFSLRGKKKRKKMMAIAEMLAMTYIKIKNEKC